MAGLFPISQKFDPPIGVDSNIDVHEAPPSALENMKNLLALNQGETIVRDGFLQLFDTIPREIIAWNWGIFHINVPADLLPGDVSYAPGSSHIVAGDNEARVYLFQVAPANDFEEQLQLWIAATDSDGNVLVQPFKLYQGVPDLFYYAPVFVSGEAHTTIMSAAPHCKIKFEHDALGNPYFLVVTGNGQTSRPLKIDFEKFDDPFGRFSTNFEFSYKPGFLFSTVGQDNDYKSGKIVAPGAFVEYDRSQLTLADSRLSALARQTSPSFALRVQTETLEKDEIVQANNTTSPAIRIHVWKNYGYSPSFLPGWWFDGAANHAITLDTETFDPLGAGENRFTPPTSGQTQATVSLLEGEYEFGIFDEIVTAEMVPTPLAKRVVQVGHERNLNPINMSDIPSLTRGLTVSVSLAIDVNPLLLPKNVKRLRWGVKFKPYDPKVTGWTEWQELSGSPIDVIGQSFSQKGYSPLGTDDGDGSTTPQYDFDNADFYIGRNLVWKGYGKILQGAYVENVINDVTNLASELSIELMPPAYKTADGVYKLSDGLFRYLQVFAKGNTGFTTGSVPTGVTPVTENRRWRILQARGYENQQVAISPSGIYLTGLRANGLRIVSNATRNGQFYYLPDGVPARLSLPIVSHNSIGLCIDRVETPDDYLTKNLLEVEIGFGWEPMYDWDAGSLQRYYNLFEFYDTVGQVNPGKVFEDRSGESIVERYEDRELVSDQVVTGNIGHINEATSQYELKPARAKIYGVDTITNYPHRHYPSLITEPLSLEDDIVALGNFTMESDQVISYAPQLVVFGRDQILLYEYANQKLNFRATLGTGGIANKFATANYGYHLFYIDKLLQTWGIDRTTGSHRIKLSDPLQGKMKPYKAIPNCVATARIAVCEIQGNAYLFEFISQQWTISSSGGGGKGVALSSFLVPSVGSQQNTLGWFGRLDSLRERGGWSQCLFEDNSLIGDVVTITLSNSGSGYVSGANKTFKIDGGNGGATFKANVSAVDGHISTAPVLLTPGIGYSNGTYNIISLTPGDPGINGVVTVAIGTDRLYDYAKEYLWLPYTGQNRALMAVSHGKLFVLTPEQSYDDEQAMVVTDNMPIRCRFTSLPITPFYMKYRHRFSDPYNRKRIEEGRIVSALNATDATITLSNEKGNSDVKTILQSVVEQIRRLLSPMFGQNFTYDIKFTQQIGDGSYATTPRSTLKELQLNFSQEGDK